MKILIYGDFEPNRGLAGAYARGFAELGHDVVRLDNRRAASHCSWWLNVRAANRLTRSSLRLRRLGATSWNEEIIRRVKATAPDVVFVIAGELVMPDTVIALRRRCKAVLAFHPDDPLPGSPNYRPEYIASAKEFDRYYVWSMDLLARLRQLGAREPEYLPFAWDPQWFPRAPAPSEPRYDVVFIGGWDPHRENWLSPIAERFDLKIWGSEYWATRTRRRSPLRASWQGGVLWGPDAARAIVESRITLNILRRQNLPDGTNMRTFEVPGAGGFLLATRTRGAERIFPEFESGAYFTTPSELAEKIEYYLTHKVERQRIAERARKNVQEKHRYVHRCAALVNDIRNGPPQSRASAAADIQPTPPTRAFGST